MTHMDIYIFWVRGLETFLWNSSQNGLTFQPWYPVFKLLLYHRTKISQEELNRKLYIVVAVDPYLLLFYLSV